MARILITDGEQRSALATARSLGRAGHDVYVAAQRRSSLAGSSRFVRDTAIAADPLDRPDLFVKHVADLVSSWHIEVVLPVTEAALLALLPHRDRIQAALPFPSAEAFRRLCDKRVVAAEADPLGIKVPRTVLIERTDFERGDAGHLSYPLIVKPHRSIPFGNGTRVKGAVQAAGDERTLRDVLAALPAAAFPVLLQERIVGPGVGIFVLLHKGRVQASFAHRRIREKPPWGGVSVLRESIPLDPDLLARSVALLRRFDFEGAAMVEYKIESRTGFPYIMEINGRFWGSLQLAIDAGVDFPALLVKAALDDASSEPPRYQSGVRSRWFWGDVDSLLITLRGHDGGTGARGSRLRACLDFLRAFGRGNRSEVLQLSDPRPAVRETVDWFRGALSRSSE